MTYEEYWFGYPCLARDYVEAERYKRKKENHASWLQGLYISHAIASTIGNAFIGKGEPPNEYPETPFPLDEEDKEEKKKEKEDREAIEAKLFMKLLVDQGKHWGKKQKEQLEQ